MKLHTPAIFAAAILLSVSFLLAHAAPAAPPTAPPAPSIDGSLDQNGAIPVPAVPLSAPAIAATPPAPAAPAVLPGKGLAQHDFFYAGEAKDRQMFIVRGGKVVWSFEEPDGKGEISDATLLSNGNVLVAHQFAVELISPDKKILWHYDVPTGNEVHTAIPIGTTHVLFIQNGDPATVHVVNIVTGATEKQFTLPVSNSKSVHGQFRHARLTADGTLLVAHMDMGKVSEYNTDGKELWTLPAPRVWGVTPLPGGHILLTDDNGVREVDRAGQATWSLTRADMPGYTLKNLQNAWRLPNGNILLNNWANQWTGPIDMTNAPVQAIEVTPNKKIVWALRSWTDPDLGPATTIQLLDTPDAPENVHFGDIR